MQAKGCFTFHVTHHFILHTITYPLTATVVGAPQMTSQPVSPFSPVLHCPVGLGELQACVFVCVGGATGSFFNVSLCSLRKFHAKTLLRCSLTEPGGQAQCVARAKQTESAAWTSKCWRGHSSAWISNKFQCPHAYWMFPHSENHEPRLSTTERERAIGRPTAGDPPK